MLIGGVLVVVFIDICCAGYRGWWFSDLLLIWFNVMGSHIPRGNKANRREVGLSNKITKAAGAPPPFRLRDVHYRIARLLAEGKEGMEIAAKTGYSASRISSFRTDKHFRGLIEHYRERLDKIADEIYATRLQKTELLAHNALDHLNDKYEDEPHLISHEQARLDYSMASERLDAGKPTVNYQLHGNLSAIPLAELVNLQRARADQLLLEASAETNGSPSSVPPSVDGDSLSEPGSVASPVPVAAATNGSASTN
jgi:hypothetical protein